MQVYDIEEIGSKFYVRVLTYNPAVWYPWSYKYISDKGYPVSKERLQYAKEFNTFNQAEQFISSRLLTQYH